MGHPDIVPTDAVDFPVSASRRVYLDLRRRIIDMTLLPGERIVERDIAAAHGLSRTPVHEAVQRLAEEGLIEIAQRVGTFVARIPLDQLETAMFIRTALEVATVERVAEKAGASGIERLDAILADQKRTVAEQDRAGFHRSDEAFHGALADLAGMPRVWQMIEQAKIQVDRYRRLTLPMPGRMDRVLHEHEAVVAAIAGGSPAAAAAAMRAHLGHVLPEGHEQSVDPRYFTSHLP